MCDDIERLIVYINDEKKEITIDDSKVDLPLPDFKGLSEQLAIPLS